MYKIAIIGTGYVGLPTGAAFAEKGNEVICVDKNLEIIERLNAGISTISEPGLDDLLKKTLKSGRLSFTFDLELAINASDIVFIAVGTPSGENGEADLTYVKAVAGEIGEKMNHPLIIVDKSTVPVGTADIVKKIITENLKKRNMEIPFSVISNPEFMAEGRAVEDMLKPGRVVVGSENEEALKVMKNLYSPFMQQVERFFGMTAEEAELTKYAANAILAMRISYINTIAIICEIMRLDVGNIRVGIGSDPRIGMHFLYPSSGFGGSCFPKDVKALISFAKKIDIPRPYIKLLESILEVNDYQKTIIPRKVISKFGGNVTGRKFALWGLAFKAKTGDMRESSSIEIVKYLTERGAEVAVFDPLAIKEAKEVYFKDIKGISYEETNMYSIVPGCDALIIATETDDYRSADFTFIKKHLKFPIIFDGRNLYNPKDLEEMGIEYFGIGKNNKKLSFIDMEA